MKKFLFVTSALAAAAVAQPAFAAVDIHGTLTFSAGGVAGILGEHPLSEGLGTFNDTFTFTLAAATTLVSGQLGTQWLQTFNDLDLTSAFISGPVPSIFFIPDADNTDANQQADLELTVLPAGAYTLNISGHVDSGPSAIYSGTINTRVLPAVPEPATWLMMIFGLGAVGYSMRRRKAYRTLQAV